MGLFERPTPPPIQTEPAQLETFEEPQNQVDQANQETSYQEELKLLARKARGASKKHLTSYIELGGHLAKAQEILADVGRAGDFSPWFRSINLAKSTVYRAIDAHKNFGNCPSLGRFSKASIDILCKAPLARSQALKDAEDGKTISVKHAKHLVKTLEPHQAKKKSDKPGLITLETQFGIVTIKITDPGISPATVLSQAMAQLDRQKRAA